MRVVFMEMYLQQYIRTVYLLCNKVSGSVSGDVLSLDIPGMFLRKANADWLSRTQYCHCFCRSDNQIYMIRWDIINHIFFSFFLYYKAAGLWKSIKSLSFSWCCCFIFARSQKRKTRTNECAASVSVCLGFLCLEKIINIMSHHPLRFF